jgi:thiamine biosynthesis lipoprotein
LYRSVTVVADNATVADGLATAFNMMSRADIDRILRTEPRLVVRIKA